MIPYFIMVGVPMALSVLLTMKGYNREKIYRDVIDSFFLIWLILLFCRSERVGVDLTVYKYHFVNYSALAWKSIITGIFTGRFEAGYVLICKLLSYITDNFRWVMVGCACISVIPVWKFYKKEGSHGFLTIVLFINIAPFVMYFSGLRQAMAMAFVVPCYYYCKDKRLWQYIGTVLAATLFHKSAFILLLMYPAFHLRLKRRIHILYFLPIERFLYVYNIPIFTFLMRFMEGKYADRYTAGIGATGAYKVTLLMTVILIYTYFIPDRNKLDSETVGLRNILTLSVMLQVFSAANPVAMRMNYYFLILVPLTITKVIKCSDNNYRSLVKLSIVCMVAFFTFYYFYGIYTDDDILRVYPYYSFIRDNIRMFN